MKIPIAFIKINILLFFLFLIGSTSLFSQQFNVYITENGRIDFVSDAPLEIINAGANELKGAIDLSNQTFLFVLQNANFKGFNSPLQQEHFHENYIETKKYPQTIFKGKIIEKLDWKPGTEQAVRAKGMLDLHGIQKERIIKAIIKYEENSVRIISDFTVFLDDHHIKIPKVVAKKIAPEIKIHVDATLKPNVKEAR